MRGVRLSLQQGFRRGRHLQPLRRAHRPAAVAHIHVRSEQHAGTLALRQVQVLARRHRLVAAVPGRVQHGRRVRRAAGRAHHFAIDRDHPGADEEQALSALHRLGLVGEKDAQARDVPQERHLVDLFGVLAAVVATDQQRLVVAHDGQRADVALAHGGQIVDLAFFLDSPVFDVHGQLDPRAIPRFDVAGRHAQRRAHGNWRHGGHALAARLDVERIRQVDHGAQVIRRQDRRLRQNVGLPLGLQRAQPGHQIAAHADADGAGRQARCAI
ncbi:hypothetical protein D9M68_735510 [compost metagenome]